MFKYSGLKSQPVDNDIIPADVEDPPATRPLQSTSSNTSGMPGNVRTIHDYPTSGSANANASLPPRPAGQGVSWGQRNCPNARFCWPFDWSSWTLDTGGDAPALLRRICMWITLATRTALAVFSLIFLFVGFHISSFVINIILDVLGFFFIAWCLARIGDAVGERRVMGTLVVSSNLFPRLIIHHRLGRCQRFRDSSKFKTRVCSGSWRRQQGEDAES